MTVVGALDLGGTKILAALYEVPGWRPLARRKVATRPEEGPDRVIERMAALVADLAMGRGALDPPGVTSRGGPASLAGLAAIGVAAPGPLDYRTRVVVQAPNLGWRNVPLGERLRAALGVPVFVDHDANLAALAEWTVRAGAGGPDAARPAAGAAPVAPDPLVYVTVSTGIGGGIISGGRILHGYRGAAGEIGHMTLQAGAGGAPAPPACNCGNTGCLEALASGTALASRARDVLGPRGPAGRSSPLAPAGPPTAEDVARLFAAGDPAARALVAEAGRWLGVGLAAVAAVLDPEIIVVGGGVAIGLGEPFLETIRDEMRRRLMPRAWEGAIPTVEPARLGEDATLLGAAILAQEAAPL